MEQFRLAVPPILPGTRFGPYEVVSFIAAGGMGEVYRGLDSRLGRAVAIKILPEDLFDNEEAILRFEREAKAAAAVSHPNLIAVHDVGQAGEVRYLVMDLLEGETLRRRLDRGALPWETAVQFAVAIAEGIRAVHAKGIVHRDLKPENIFLTTDGWVKLLDFGLAVPHLRIGEPSSDNPTLRVITRKGTLIGTVAYMSPEQLREETIDARSDLFAIGCVLYEMLCGEAAFARLSHAKTINAILNETLVVLPPSVPADLSRIVQRCLERPRDRRFPSAADLASALRLVTAPAVVTDQPSIAVMPFANLSGDKENDYFSDGLSEEILTALTLVPGLKVTARTSAFAFRGKHVDVRTIGEALGVRTILEGSVRRAENRVRVTAQLVDAASGYQLWSARYDREMSDVFVVQDEIAATIARTLHLQLRRNRLPVRTTSNVNAYHAYLKSRYHFAKLNPERLPLSRAYAEEAIQLDPEYPAAQAQLGECLIQAAVYGLKPSLEAVPLAREAALKAVALDPGVPSAHMTLARIAGEFDADWDEALRRCRLALASDRISPAIRALCAQYVLWPLGRIDELTAAIEPALTADPLSPMPRTVQAQAFVARGSHEHALELIDGVMELHEYFWPGYVAHGMIDAVAGRMEDAISWFERGLRVAQWNTSLIGLLGGSYARIGDRTRAASLRARLDLPQFALLSALGRSAYHATAGEYERSAEEFDAVIEARYPIAAYYLTWLSLFEGFRESAGGRALRQKVKL